MPEPIKTDEVEATPEVIQATGIQQPVSSSNQQLKPTVSAPDTPFDINKVAQTNSGGATIALILATVMIIIGIVGRKLWKKLSKTNKKRR